MNADILTASMTEMWKKLAPLVAGSRLIRESGAVAVITGIPLPMLNGVFLEQARPRADVVVDLLDEVAAAGLPHCLQLRPGSGEALTEIAVGRKMTHGGEIPLMVLDAAAAERVLLTGRAGDGQSGFVVRPLSPEEAPLHARVAAAEFGMTMDQMLRLCSTDALRLGLMRCYVAEVGGQPVSTAIGVTAGSFTGIINVATLPGFRGRGLGTAVTARAVADGLAAGASGCWLQSSVEGYFVYQKLGFRTVETCQLWLSAEGAT
jgi:ribosomal protein S18 acetylase RimI-like enzyme